MFTLTNYQKYICEILEQTRYLRVDQVYRLLKLDGEDWSDVAFARGILSQLQNINRVFWLSDDTVTLLHLRNSEIDAEMLTAVDVMLDLLSLRPVAISSSRPPFTLSFLAYRDEKLLPYGVIIVRPGGEKELNFQVADRRGEVIIFVLTDVEQSKLICTKATHFFAVFDGKQRRYFKGQGT